MPCSILLALASFCLENVPVFSTLLALVSAISFTPLAVNLAIETGYHLMTFQGQRLIILLDTSSSQ